MRSLRVDSNNLADLEAQIPILTSIPQKAFVILYRGRGLDNGYDYVILLTEKLLAASGKHVVLICDNRNCVNKYSLEYSSYAEPAFDTWKERIFACVLDNSQNDFVYYRELYYAIKGCGYIDAIRNCLGFIHPDAIDEEKVKQLIAEAKEKLSTFKDTIIKEDEKRERHLISSLVVRPEDKKFERYMSKDSVSIWIDISKATGTILNWQGSFPSRILCDDTWYSDAPM